MTRAPFCVKENDTVTQPLEELAGRASLVPSGEESACKCRWAISEGEGSTKVQGWQFLLGWEISQKIITAALGKECGDFHELGPSHFLTFMVSLGTVMGPVGVSFSLLLCYSEHVLRLTV